MICAYFDKLSADNHLAFSEGLLSLKASWVLSAPRLDAEIRRAAAIVNGIAERDRFELIFDAGEHRLSVQSPADLATVAFADFVKSAGDISEVEVDLTIHKVVAERRASVYSMERFAAYFESPLPATLRSIASALDGGRLIFEVFDGLRPFHTSAIRFENATSNRTFVVASEDDRQDRLQAHLTNTNASGVPSGLLPSDVYLLVRSEYPQINAFFDRATAVLSIAFLANTSELQESGRFAYKFNGYKAVVCSSVDLGAISGVAAILHELYAWAYGGGSAADKLGLVRNVISIHLDERGQPRFDREVLSAVSSNYQIYLKGNIQSYLEIKNKIAELLLDSIERTARGADDVLDSFKNNVFIVATFLLTVVVINGVKDSNFAAVFSGPYVLLVSFLAISSLLWLFLIRRDAVCRYQTSAHAVEQLLRESYGQFLMKAELDGALRPTLDRNSDTLRLRIRTYTTWWIVLLSILLTFFVIGNRLYGPSTTGQAAVSKDEAQLGGRPSDGADARVGAPGQAQGAEATAARGPREPGSSASIPTEREKGATRTKAAPNNRERANPGPKGVGQ